uniref:Uncharacterized protein n=1 Tax=Hucho hucho TaxID=62062 RepID=A0A4W5KAU6_9TELE
RHFTVSLHLLITKHVRNNMWSCCNPSLPLHTCEKQIVEYSHCLNPVEYSHCLNPVEYSHCLNPVEYSHCLNPVEYSQCLNPVEYSHCLNPVEYSQCLNPVEYSHCLNPIECNRLHSLSLFGCGSAHLCLHSSNTLSLL